MATLRQCEFFLLRYAPTPFAEEAVNIGVVLRDSEASESRASHARENIGQRESDQEGFRDIRFSRKWNKGLIPDATYLEALKTDLAEKFKTGGEPLGQILRSMHDAWSNQIRISDPRPVLTESPAQEIEKLAGIYLDRQTNSPRFSASPRQKIRRQMQRAFEDAGVWKLLRKEISVADYTQDDDPLKIDCGYRPNGVIRMFHAVSLESGREAKALAFSYPGLIAGIAKKERARTELTAIVADNSDLNSSNSTIEFSRRVLENSQILISTAAQLPAIAQKAADELRAGM